MKSLPQLLVDTAGAVRPLALAGRAIHHLEIAEELLVPDGRRKQVPTDVWRLAKAGVLERVGGGVFRSKLDTGGDAPGAK